MDRILIHKNTQFFKTPPESETMKAEKINHYGRRKSIS